MINTESKSLISADLLKSIEALLSGARIEKVESDAQLAASVELLKNVKRTAADLESERKERVAPLNKQVDDINDEYKEKKAALDGLAKNLSNKGAEYQLEQARLKREEEERLEREAEAERKRLADLESKRLEEEDRLRREAADKLAQAEAATAPEERAALIEEANTASAVADVAAQEAVDAAQAVQTVAAPPVQQRVFTPQGFKGKTKYLANVTDHRAAMAWIVENKEWGAIENMAFFNCVNAAMNKIAGLKQEAFKVPGCSLVKEAAGRVRY